MTTTPSCIMEGKTSPILLLISCFSTDIYKIHPQGNSLSPSICRTAFTIQYGKETITPIPNPSVQIGQRKEMSDIDIQRINKLYECGEHITHI